MSSPVVGGRAGGAGAPVGTCQPEAAFGGVRVTVDPTSSSPGGPGPRTYGPGAPCVTWRFWIGPPTTQEVGHESRRNCRAESDDREHCKRPFEWRSTVPAPATQ